VGVPVRIFTVEFAPLSPAAMLTTKAPVLAEFARLSAVAATAVASDVLLVEVSVVALTAFGAEFPRAGGDANRPASKLEAVAGDT